MKIWLLAGDVGKHDSFTYVDSTAAIQLIHELCQKPTRANETWNPLEISTLESRGGRSSFHPEMLLPVIDNAAAEAIQPLLNDYVELLPLTHPEGTYWLINFPQLLDCIDPEQSEFTRFSDGAIKKYTKFSFKEDVIAHSCASIFSAGFHDLPHASTGHTFVTEQFINRVTKSGLQGFRFVEVWDSNQK